MDANITLQIFSNVVSIVICVIILLKYINYKKRLDVLQNLEDLKVKNELSQEDKDYISNNEKEYFNKAQLAEATMKLTYPVLILITGVIFAFMPFSEAMIHVNVVVVTFLYFMLDKNHKNTTHNLLKELNS